MISLSTTSIFVLSQLAILAQCHLKLQQPVPYSPSTLQLSPLQNALPGSAESDFPCQLKRQGGADPFEVEKENELEVGKTNTMTFDGSASHGGGTCQLSVTLDRKPTANSKFKTIVSWIGGCPIDSSSGGTIPWNYTIPPEVPNGKATLAWSWVSKLSGQPEFYMNCAPITVSGGADDTTKFDELEDLFRVNLPSSQCGSQLSSNLEIPKPGKYVTTIDTHSLLLPTGSGCAALGQATGGVGGGATASAQAPAYTVSSGSSDSPDSPDSSGASTTLIPAYSSTAPFTNSTPAYSTPPSSSQIPSSSPSTYSSSTQCSPDGALVCNGPDQFGLCNFGKVVFQPVAAGTSCEQGQIMRKRHLASHKHKIRGHSRARSG